MNLNFDFGLTFSSNKTRELNLQCNSKRLVPVLALLYAMGRSFARLFCSMLTKALRYATMGYHDIVLLTNSSVGGGSFSIRLPMQS